MQDPKPIFIKLESGNIQNSADQRFIEKIADLTPSVILLYDIKTGKFLFANNSVDSILGISSRKIMEESDVSLIDNIIHPDDVVLARQKINELLSDANKPVTDFIARIHIGNNQYKWFHNYVSVFERDASNNVEKIMLHSIDVDQEISANIKLQQKVEELRSSEERFHKMIEEIEDYAVILMDIDGYIQNWNYGAQKIKGYEASEIIGRNFRIFYTEEDIERMLPEKLIQQALITGKASHEGWRLRKDKSRFWGNILITALHDSKGKVIGFTKITRDLTQKKLAEDRLQKYLMDIEQKNTELEEKNKELESFNYIASHDLQEPLRKIRILCSQIAESGQLPEKIQGMFVRVQNASARMQNLIEGLMEYSQIGFQQASYTTINLNKILENVLSEFSDQIASRKIKIVKTNLPSIQGIQFQFQQLFFNIVSNAIKYTNKSASPEIIFTYEKTDKVEGNAEAGKTWFHKISITDNGIGFKQEYAEKIFDLFQRLHERVEYEGTGIGLAICKRVAQNHKGIISAFSEENKGARFTIFLPVDALE
jgi:PAS domain S-box-containing protein